VKIWLKNFELIKKNIRYTKKFVIKLFVISKKKCMESIGKNFGYPKIDSLDTLFVISVFVISRVDCINLFIF
jgi:hypothetical protein